MHRANWSIMVVTSVPRRGPRFVGLNRWMVIGACLFAIGGGIGCVRCAFVVAAYAHAKLGVYVQGRGNRELLQKVTFLERLINEHTKQIDNLVEFEDNMRLRFGLSSISKDVRLAGVGGGPTVEEIVLSALDPNIGRADSVRERITGLMRQVELQNVTFSRMSDHVIREYRRWAQQPSVRPARGRFTSGYGYRNHPLFGREILHEGIDIANKVWTPIFASADGVVSFVGRRHELGNAVFLDHSASGYETIYAHLREAAVVEGQSVKRGELVGYMGNSGRSTGPHLHYEVRRLRNTLNPERFFLPTAIAID